MVNLALFVRLEAKPGKEEEVQNFLRSALPFVREESATTAWFGIRLGPSTFGIFDVFESEEGRRAHLRGRLAEALRARGAELFAEPPVIQHMEVLSAKLPGFGLLLQKIGSKLGTILTLAGAAAAAWFAAKRYRTASRPYEVLQQQPARSPM